MKIQADQQELDIDRLIIEMNDKEFYLISIKNGKLHIIKDSKHNMQILPSSNNCIELS